MCRYLCAPGITAIKPRNSGRGRNSRGHHWITLPSVFWGKYCIARLKQPQQTFFGFHTFHNRHHRLRSATGFATPSLTFCAWQSASGKVSSTEDGIANPVQHLAFRRCKAVRRNHGRVPPNGNNGRNLPIRADAARFSADHTPVSALRGLGH